MQMAVATLRRDLLLEGRRKLVQKHSIADVMVWSPVHRACKMLMFVTSLTAARLAPCEDQHAAPASRTTHNQPLTQPTPHTGHYANSLRHTPLFPPSL